MGREGRERERGGGKMEADSRAAWGSGFPATARQHKRNTVRAEREEEIFFLFRRGQEGSFSFTWHYMLIITCSWYV